MDVQTGYSRIGMSVSGRLLSTWRKQQLLLCSLIEVMCTQAWLLFQGLFDLLWPFLCLVTPMLSLSVYVEYFSGQGIVGMTKLSIIQKGVLTCSSHRKHLVTLTDRIVWLQMCSGPTPQCLWTSPLTATVWNGVTCLPLRNSLFSSELSPCSWGSPWTWYPPFWASQLLEL